MFARTGMTLSVAIAIVVGCFWGGGVAFGDPPPVIGEKYTIQKQIDPVRYVKTVIFRNNTSGDFIYEFSARRTDLSNTYERWTLTFVNDPLLDQSAILEVDGVEAYRMTLDDLELSAPEVSITVGTQTGEIDMDDPCNDPGFDLFKTLVNQVEDEREVVAAVLQAIQDPLSGADEDCIQDCHEEYPQPPFCDSTQLCDEKFTCCETSAYAFRCAGNNCLCDNKFGIEAEECYEAVAARYQERIAICTLEYFNCVLDLICM